jgi:hypothetical protein
MRTLRIIPIALLVAVAVAPAPAGAAVARHFEGTVVSVDRDARTFRLDDAERGVKRIHVNSRTRFERIAGRLGGLKAGMSNIEATVRRSNGRWVAVEVERSGGGGQHGGHSGGSDDD